MIIRALKNKDLFANVILALMIVSLIGDMAFPGARMSTDITPHSRIFCHVLLVAILVLMFFFVCFNYTLPRIPAVIFWELSLFVFLSISTCYAVFLSSRDQLINFSKFVYWPVGYFFFRVLADDVREYNKKLFCLLVIISIYAIWSYISENKLRSEFAERDMIASSNVGWTLLQIYSIALCLAIRGNQIGYMAAVVALLLVPLSLKRGAIMAEAVLIASLLFAGYRLGLLGKFIRENQKWIILILFVWILLFVSQTGKIVERFSDMVVDGGSGRLQFYRLLFDRWQEADLFHWFFGFGFWSTPEYLGRAWLDSVYAHSDWLEILHDYGLVGILVYVMMLLGCFLICRESWRTRDERLIVSASVFSLFLVKGMISGNVMFRGTVYLMIPLAYMVGKLEKRNTVLNIVKYGSHTVGPVVYHNLSS
jgi:hypothetical protein